MKSKSESQGTNCWYEKEYLTPAEVCRCPLNKRFKDAIYSCDHFELNEIYNILVIHRFDFLDDPKKYRTYYQRYNTSDKLRFVDEVRELKQNSKTVLWKPN